MTEDTSNTSKPETRSFEAEVSRLLHMMVHSVYSNRDIFLRELVSNAADACEKLRHEALLKPDLIKDDPEFRITLHVDTEKSVVILTDNGVGMSKEELIDNLGTIAHSGTKAFLDSMEEKDQGAALIGQFGVGFYSSFMVADKVVVTSRTAGSEETNQWVSDGTGTYTIESVNEGPARGTTIELHLKEDAKEYADRFKIEQIVREYSSHVPIQIDLLPSGEEKETKVLADGSALWTKSKSDITEEQYKEFYNHSAGAYDDPALTIHYKAEGRHEYHVLTFIPTHKPFDLFDSERKGRVKLYVKRVFISDDAEILPSYLRFTKGIVDSEDLPLNISREMLQHNPILEAIRSGLTKRVLTELGKLAKKDDEAYLSFWEAFGPVLKEGLYEDAPRRDDLFKLVRFKSVQSGDKWINLESYVAALKENQTSIYYALGDTPDAVKASPHLEGYKARGIDVLLLTDPVDAFWVQTALGFDGKSFKSISQGSADLDAMPLEGKDEVEAKPDDAESADLILALTKALDGKVSEVRTSVRLDTSAVCLVAPEYGPDRQLEKMLRQREGSNQDSINPILEINSGHSLIKTLAELAKSEGNGSDKLEDAALMLLDQARILDGEAPADPVRFTNQLAELLALQFKS